jgi:GNAT superfamily N-acetyltransferase
MTIRYQTDTSGVEPSMLTGYFGGWPNPPSPQTHLRMLEGSDHIVLAVDDEPRVVGFITAISDGVSCAYIPHLAVIDELRGQGIGSELVRRLLAELKEIYMIDLLCDADVVPFYDRLGFQPVPGMAIRNFHNQAGL